MARIRELTLGDIPELVEILATSEPWITAGETRENLRQIIESPLASGNLFVLEEDSRPAGLVYFISEPILANGGYIRFLAVREDLRRRGLGRQLMGFVERKVFSQAASVYLTVSPFNEPARKFYEKLGYIKVGEIADSRASGQTEWILRKTTARKAVRRRISTGRSTN